MSSMNCIPKAYSTGSSMQKHITEMRALQRKLQHKGSHVDGTILGLVILTSVRNVFPTTVEMLRSREPPPTLRQIIDRLLAKETEAQRVTATKRSEPDEDQVLDTNKTDNPKPWAKKPKVRCLFKTGCKLSYW